MAVAHQAPTPDRDTPVRRVDLFRWPADAGRREGHLAEGRACLWLVEPGAPPPETGPGEDWAWRLTDERDLHARLARLAGRQAEAAADARPVLATAPDGVLTRHDRTVVLDPLQAQVVDRLGARFGRVVTRTELGGTTAGGRPLSDRSVDRVVHALRRLLRPLGLDVHTIRGRGFLLEDALPPAADPTPGDPPSPSSSRPPTPSADTVGPPRTTRTSPAASRCHPA